MASELERVDHKGVETVVRAFSVGLSSLSSHSSPISQLEASSAPSRWIYLPVPAARQHCVFGDLGSAGLKNGCQSRG